MRCVVPPTAASQQLSDTGRLIVLKTPATLLLHYSPGFPRISLFPFGPPAVITPRLHLRNGHWPRRRVPHIRLTFTLGCLFDDAAGRCAW
jgi:hypothetical protein